MKYFTVHCLVFPVSIYQLQDIKELQISYDELDARLMVQHYTENIVEAIIISFNTCNDTGTGKGIVRG